jgi:dienelactone hydrolase
MDSAVGLRRGGGAKVCDLEFDYYGAGMNPFKFPLWCALLGATVSLSAAIVSKPVVYEQDGVKLEGWLAYDDAQVSASKKAPGVLVMPEWWGLTSYPKDRAVELAKLGYVAFAVDFYGQGVVTRDKQQASELSGKFYGKPLMVERGQAGLEQLLATGLVDEKRVAAIGYCFGGAAAQLLAYSGAPLAGIVSFHGSLIAASPEAATKNRAKFLVCHGAVDPFVSADELAKFEQSMNEGKFDYQFISYAGAVHAFTNPDADKLGAENQLPVRYDAAADKRSWAHMKLFFGEIFGELKP